MQQISGERLQDHWSSGLKDIFLIFTENIGCGYTLEPTCRGGLNDYPQPMFWSESKKNRYTPAYPSSPTYDKSGVQGGKHFTDMFS